MKIFGRAHFQAAKDLVELMSVAGWIAIFADCIWVVRDSIVNGFTPAMCLIISLLFTALASLSYGLWCYHINNVKIILKEALKTKLELCKRKFYHKS